MISKHTPEGIYSYASPACRALLGYEPDELIGHSAYDFFHPEDMAKIAEVHSPILKLPDTDTASYRIQRKDGSYIWFETTSRTIREDKTAEASEIIAISRDVTEGKRAERSLREMRKAERRRIARDLHDVALQDLSGALQALQATQLEAKSPGEVDLGREIDALRRAVGGLRNAVYNLRLEKEQPFLKSVESLVELNRQMTPERLITLTAQDGFPQEIEAEAGVELVRFLQEALANARNHSGARRVWVTLRKEGRELRAEVTDDGCGFSLETRSNGLGISGMRARV